MSAFCEGRTMPCLIFGYGLVFGIQRHGEDLSMLMEDYVILYMVATLLMVILAS